MSPDDNPEQAIRLLRKCQEELRTKVERHRRDLEAVDRAIELLQQRPPAMPVTADPNQSSYAELGPRWAVAKYFQECPGIAIKPSTLAKELVEMGCKRTNRDNNVFVAQIRTACLRLTEKGLLQQTTLDGKVAFQLKKPTENQ